MNERFERITNPIDTAKSVVWSLRYFECGTFRAVFPADAALLATVRQARYLCTWTAGNEDVRCGRIEYIGCSANEWLEVSGRMLECLLCDRVMSAPWSITGWVSDAVISAVTTNQRGLSLQIGEDSATIDDTVTVAAEWETVSDWVYRVLRPFGASYTVTLDVERMVPVFRIVYPSTTASVVFSGSFENIAEVMYEYHASELKTTAYVEGADGTVECVELADGADRREIFRRAGDIRPSSFASTEAYLAALQTKGRMTLSERNAEEYISCMARRDSFPEFGADYRLGDLCYVDDPETGLSVETRVTGADEVWELGSLTVYPAFGSRVPGIQSAVSA